MRYRDRFVLALVAAALIAAGLLALNSPTTLDEFDRWGFRIVCGTGFTADYGQAEIADATETSSDYVGQCGSAVTWRRTWAGGLVLLGAGLSLGLALRWQRNATVESRPD